MGPDKEKTDLSELNSKTPTRSHSEIRKGVNTNIKFNNRSPNLSSININQVTDYNKSTISLMNSPCISNYDIQASYTKMG